MDLTTAQQTIERIASGARQQMDTITRDERYNPDHKTKEVMRIREETLTSLREYADAQRAGIESERNQLTSKANAPILPAPELVPVLLYEREKLAQKWRAMSLPDLQTDFESAVNAKDEIKVRLYLDFGEAQLAKAQTEYLRSLKTPAVSGTRLPTSTDSQPAVISQKWQELVTQGVDLLSTPEQRKARRALGELEQAQGKLNLTIGTNTVNVQGLSYDPRTGAIGERIGKEKLFSF